MGVAQVEAAVEGGDGEAAGTELVEQAGGESLEVRELTGEQRAAVIDYVRSHKGCSVKEACDASGVRRFDFRALRKSDQEFADDYADARGYGKEQILGGMVRLGIEGVEEYVVSAGKIVQDEAGKPLTVRRYDSRALIALFNGMTDEGKAMVAGRLGIDVNVSGVNAGPVQAGVSMAEVAKVLLEANVDLRALAEGPGEIEGEIVADEPA